MPLDLHLPRWCTHLRSRQSDDTNRGEGPRASPNGIFGSEAEDETQSIRFDSRFDLLSKGFLTRTERLAGPRSVADTTLCTNRKIEMFFRGDPKRNRGDSRELSMKRRRKSRCPRWMEIFRTCGWKTAFAATPTFGSCDVD